MCWRPLLLLGQGSAVLRPEGARLQVAALGRACKGGLPRHSGMRACPWHGGVMRGLWATVHEGTMYHSPWGCMRGLRDFWPQGCMTGANCGTRACPRHLGERGGLKGALA